MEKSVYVCVGGRGVVVSRIVWSDEKVCMCVWGGRGVVVSRIVWSDEKNL